MKGKNLIGLLFKNSPEEYELWTEFSITQEEATTLEKIMENHINEGGAWIGESLQDILEQISDDLSDVLASEKSDSDNSQYDGKDCKRVLSERELFTLDAPAEEDIKEDKEHDRVMYLSCETAEKNFRSAVADMLETCRSLESIKAILEEEFINFPGVKSKK